MKKFKDINGAANGVRRLCAAVILASVMIVAFAMPIMPKLSEACEACAEVPMITSGESGAGKLLPLKMEVPPDYPGDETSRDVRI